MREVFVQIPDELEGLFLTGESPQSVILQALFNKRDTADTLSDIRNICMELLVREPSAAPAVVPAPIIQLPIAPRPSPVAIPVSDDDDDDDDDFENMITK